MAEIAKTSLLKTSPDSFFCKKPTWKFEFFDKELWTPIGHLDGIILKFSDLEKTTWAIIDGTPKSGNRTTGSRNHFVNVEDLISDAQDRLVELHLNYSQIYSIALTGKKRLWGILEDGVFGILWYDPEHEICPSLKKHT